MTFPEVVGRGRYAMGRREGVTYQSQLVSVLPLAAWTPGRSAAKAARRREVIARIVVAVCSWLLRYRDSKKDETKRTRIPKAQGEALHIPNDPNTTKQKIISDEKEGHPVRSYICTAENKGLPCPLPPLPFSHRRVRLSWKPTCTWINNTRHISHRSTQNRSAISSPFQPRRHGDPMPEPSL